MDTPCVDHGQRGSAKGYGSTVFRGRPEKYHRAAYMGEHNCSLLNGTVVRHSCDNPRCINPDHLSLGNIADNNRDRDDRGRTARGIQSGRAKLSETDVKTIRDLYRTGGHTHRSLAGQYGVDHKTISAIIRRKTWTHI